MASRVPALTTKELSLETGPDFARLFSQKNGWNHCWCMHFHQPRSLPEDQRLASRAKRAMRNRRQKKELVERGGSHGVLVYAKGEPVGWCQCGLREELPRIDNSRPYRGLAPEGTEKLWRITCFVVAKQYRRRGVASSALRAALQATWSRPGSTRCSTQVLVRKSNRSPSREPEAYCPTRRGTTSTAALVSAAAFLRVPLLPAPSRYFSRTTTSFFNSSAPSGCW
jgi:ribosomal protein S18 acetylase RimI-like enzyme